MNCDTSWEGNLKVIRAAAWRYLRRAHAAGASTVQIEDITSELAIAWITARDNWRPEFQVPFGAYLQRGMMLHINRWLDKEIGASHLAPVSLDKSMTEDDEGSLHEVLTDNAPRIDDVLAEKNHMAKVVSRLSPVTRKFVELLVDPPREVCEEFAALRARSEFASRRGLIPTASPRSITETLVFDIMALSGQERTRVRKEIKDAIRKVSK